MFQVPTAIALLLAVSAMACNSNVNSAFERERNAVEHAMPSESRLLSSVGARRNSGAVEASWRYEIDGSTDDVKSTLRTAFKSNYQLVHEDADSLSFARFESGDSFHLNVSLEAQRKGPIEINIVLKALPD